MKFRLFVSFLFISVIASAQAPGKTLVLSDIDDTLKVSHIQSSIGRIWKGLQEGESFSQMPLLLNELVQAQVNVHYVSNAPATLMTKRHFRFLEKHEYPQGGVYLHKSGPKKFHKRDTIRKLIADENPQFILLFGDDGERDPQIYESLAREFPDRQFMIFIRRNYAVGKGAMIPPGQQAFVSAAEVAWTLTETGFLSTEQALQITAETLQEQKLALPKWTNCEGHRADLTRFRSLSETILTLEAEIQARCL